MEINMGEETNSVGAGCDAVSFRRTVTRTRSADPGPS